MRPFVDDPRATTGELRSDLADEDAADL